MLFKRIYRQGTKKREEKRTYYDDALVIDPEGGSNAI